MRTLLLLISGLLGAASPAATQTGAPPQRVASLNLASDEILADILPLAKLVSVTALIDEPGTSNAVGRIPKNIARFPKVADHFQRMARRPAVQKRKVVQCAKRILQAAHPVEEGVLRIARPQRHEELGQIAQGLQILAQFVAVPLGHPGKVRAVGGAVAPGVPHRAAGRCRR